MQLGATVAVITIVSSMIPSINRLVTSNIYLQKARVAFDRIYEFVELPPEYKLNDKVENGTIKLDSLSVKELSFNFPGRKKLLDNISFDIKMGEIIAILG